MEKKIKKVVLAYSGGLDTSIIIPWLKENYDNCEVIAVSADVGQESELEGLEEKALKTGASKLYIEDLRKEFIEDYIYPTMQAGAVYENKYLLGTQRDIYRMETRGADYRAKALTSFNDLYQNVSILCEGKNYESCLSFARHLNEDCAGVEELGMVSEKTTHTGTMADIQSAEYEHSIKSFVGEGYMKSVRQAIKNGDANSLKNLLN